MTRRGAAIAAVAVLGITGCANAPVSESDFQDEMTALPGVDVAYVSRTESLPLLYAHEAYVGLSRDATGADIGAVLDTLHDLPAFDSYSFGTDSDGPYGLDWWGQTLPSVEVEAVLTAAWDARRTLPEQTDLDVGERGEVWLEVWNREAAEDLGDLRTVAVAVADFAQAAADAHAGVAVHIAIGPVGFDGTPASCPLAEELVTEVVAVTNIRVLSISCDPSGNRLTATVDGDPDLVELAVADAASRAGVDVFLTPAGVSVAAGIPEDVAADVALMAEAAQLVPGAPSSQATSTGVKFSMAEEETVRAVVASLEAMPEFQARSAEFTIGGYGNTATIGKSVGAPLYFDELVGVIHTPGVSGIRVTRTRDQGELTNEISIEADDAEAAAAALALSGLREAQGLSVTIMGFNAERGSYLRLTCVVQPDGTLKPSFEVDPTDGQAFLDAWNAAG